MSGIAEVLLNLGYKVSGSDLRESDTTQRLRAARRRDPDRPPGREHHVAPRGRDLLGGEEGQRRGRRRPREAGAGDPAGRDAGRADAAQVRRGHRGRARQDHDHLHGGHGAGRGRHRPDGGHRRKAQQPRLQRQAGPGGVPRGRGRRERRQLPEAVADDRRGDEHRRGAPGLLQGHQRDQGRLPRSSSTRCRSTAWRSSAWTRSTSSRSCRRSRSATLPTA